MIRDDMQTSQNNWEYACKHSQKKAAGPHQRHKRSALFDVLFSKYILCQTIRLVNMDWPRKSAHEMKGMCWAELYNFESLEVHDFRMCEYRYKKISPRLESGSRRCVSGRSDCSFGFGIGYWFGAGTSRQNVGSVLSFHISTSYKCRQQHFHLLFVCLFCCTARLTACNYVLQGGWVGLAHRGSHTSLQIFSDPAAVPKPSVSWNENTSH